MGPFNNALSDRFKKLLSSPTGNGEVDDSYGVADSVKIF